MPGGVTAWRHGTCAMLLRLALPPPAATHTLLRPPVYAYSTSVSATLAPIDSAQRKRRRLQTVVGLSDGPMRTRRVAQRAQIKNFTGTNTSPQDLLYAFAPHNVCLFCTGARKVRQIAGFRNCRAAISYPMHTPHMTTHHGITAVALYQPASCNSWCLLRHHREYR
jgi:hypothetical protein